jgi:hypothetical protein
VSLVGFPLCSLWLNEVYDSRSLLTTRNTKEIPQGAQGMPATYEIIEVNDIELLMDSGLSCQLLIQIFNLTFNLNYIQQHNNHLFFLDWDYY